MQNQEYTPSPTSSTVPEKSTVQVHPNILTGGDNFDFVTLIPNNVDETSFIQAADFVHDATLVLDQFNQELEKS